jgi:hypothetical protein
MTFCDPRCWGRSAGFTNFAFAKPTPFEINHRSTEHTVLRSRQTVMRRCGARRNLFGITFLGGVNLNRSAGSRSRQ